VGHGGHPAPPTRITFLQCIRDSQVPSCIVPTGSEVPHGPHERSTGCHLHRACRSTRHADWKEANPRPPPPPILWCQRTGDHCSAMRGASVTSMSRDVQWRTRNHLLRAIGTLFLTLLILPSYS